MQTFLPLPDFEKSAQVLDYRRLGKQRVEALQLLRATKSDSAGWSKHPAALMWKPWRRALKLYHNVMIQEWIKRGYRNTMRVIRLSREPIVFPDWFGDPKFHASHRSNLLRKDPEFYGQFGWREPDDLPYIWTSAL